ncbi:carbamoyl-phosphate synthase large subunit [bacterium]
MPKRTDIKKILIIGSGPIIIGQACEFDYSGTQACRALSQEGYDVILVNSNPATIMTDPDIAFRTYIEPITCEVLTKVIEIEKPDVLLPTLGGQTGLNLAVELYEAGILEKHNVELIGASYSVIKKAEDRNQFRSAMSKIGMDLPKSDFAYTLEQGEEIVKKIGFPMIVRPSFTLGGTGGGFVYNIEEAREIISYGLRCSPINEVLLEESILGWKEYELEVMRDNKDNVVIICSIENIDPMGVHTGDSITVAPAQTLTDREYQIMRDSAIKVIREIGVETGGSNIQFAVNPKTGRMVVIEMNPRVSRSSALASKATGFPIAKIAAKLAVGYTLDEIPNDITKETPASFEPTIDYCVVKIPRFTFEKFKGSVDVLGVSMKSVGEAMSLGRSFTEAFQKGLNSLEIGCSGFLFDKEEAEMEKIFLNIDTALREEFEGALKDMLTIPSSKRIFAVRYALKLGWPQERISEITGIDIWFIAHMAHIVDLENEIKKEGNKLFKNNDLVREIKRAGFSDRQIGRFIGINEDEVRKKREDLNIKPVFKLVDTCAAEFEAYTPYYYSTYDSEDEGVE